MLGDFFADVHRREQWYALVEERDRIEAERRQRRLDKATELARVHHREGERYKVLLRRVEAWKERQAIEEYLEALEGVPEAEEWLNWCKERLTKTCALGETDCLWPCRLTSTRTENLLRHSSSGCRRTKVSGDAGLSRGLGSGAAGVVGVETGSGAG